MFCSNQRAHCMCRLCRTRTRLLRERDGAPCSLTVRSGAVVVKYAHLRDWKQEQLLPLPLLPLLLLPCRFQFASPFARHWNCFYGGLPCCLPAIEASHIEFLLRFLVYVVLVPVQQNNVDISRHNYVHVHMYVRPGNG